MDRWTIEQGAAFTAHLNPNGIPGITPGQTAPGTAPDPNYAPTSWGGYQTGSPVAGPVPEWPEADPGIGLHHSTSPKLTKDIDLDKEPPLEMDPMYAHLQDLYDGKGQMEHAEAPSGPEDRQGPIREKRTLTMDVPKQGRIHLPEHDMDSPPAQASTPAEVKKGPARRTKSRAGDVATVRNMLAIPSDKEYQYAISTLYKDKAHLQPLENELASQITYRDGMPFYHDYILNDKDLEHYHDDTLKAMVGVDLPMLYFLYSQIFYDLQERFRTPAEIDAALKDPLFRKHSVVFFVPEFLEMFGLDHNMGQDSIDSMIKKFASYHKIMGIIPTSDGPSHYPVMIMTGPDAEKNTIKITSPYFNQIIMRARRDSYKAVGSPRPKNRGLMLPAPVVSTLIKASISKEQNKNAVEMVYRIVVLIEQAGPSKKSLPHVNALDLVNDCEHLRLNLANKSTNEKNTILRRAFTGAWQLLEEQTTLQKHYKNIRFPFSKKTPTYLKLKEVTFEFPHEGKIKKRAAENEDDNAGDQR